MKKLFKILLFVFVLQLGMVGQVICVNDNYALAGGGTDTETGSGVVPVPEPSTFILLASGLIGLIWYRRKNK